MKTPETQVTVIETDYNKHEMHSTIQYRADSTLKTIQIIKLTQNRNTIMITMKCSNLKAKTTRPIHSNSTKRTTHDRNPKKSNIENNSQIQENNSQNKKYAVRKRKTSDMESLRES